MIETLFKQLKQNFPLRYFYGESANAIKIQVWCTLIANLLLILIKSSVSRFWSFSELATMIRIHLMYYVNYKNIFEYPEKDWDLMIEEVIKPPNHLLLFDYGGLKSKKDLSVTYSSLIERCAIPFSDF